jgi:outer membrane protein assembly factor BamB
MSNTTDTMRHRRALGVLIGLLALMITGVDLVGEDWPTHRRDNQRSGWSDETLKMPLTVAWVYRSKNPPSPAWAAPPKRNYYTTDRTPLKSRVAFDRAFHVAVVGNGLYFGSSVNDSVYRLDTRDGSVDWSFTADGPVRMAPSIHAGNVYFGAEDGCAYAIRETNGSLVWKYAPSAERNYLMPSDGRFVSPWPVRSGVVVEDGIAYFSAGIFPSMGVYVCAIDALTASDRNAGHWRRLRTNDVSLQGYVLASDTKVYFPSGRSSPYAFARSNGSLAGQFRSGSSRGTFALLAGDRLINGPSSRRGAFLEEFDAERPSGESLATYDGGNSMVVTATKSFLLSDDSLTAIERASRRVLWRRNVSFPYELILAGSTLFAGGDGNVAAFDAQTGADVWSAPVDGRAYGLAVANEMVFVSTDRGVIHAFNQSGAGGNTFVRGDANGDDFVDVSDAVTIIRNLFVGAALLVCEDHGDVDDNGVIEVTDAIRLLDYLYRGGRSPAAPFPDRGPDPTNDGFDCGDPL